MDNEISVKAGIIEEKNTELDRLTEELASKEQELDTLSQTLLARQNELDEADKALDDINAIFAEFQIGVVKLQDEAIQRMRKIRDNIINNKKGGEVK